MPKHLEKFREKGSHRVQVYRGEDKCINGSTRSTVVIYECGDHEEIVQFLADNISTNVREIEGALSSLVANASFLGRKITTSLAKEILKAYVHLYQKEITIDHIIEVVCSYLSLDAERFNSAERTREIAQARQIAMYLAKQHTKAPLATIGAAIGGRNHATVLHSCKAISNLLETDKMFRRQVEEIEKLVLA